MAYELPAVDAWPGQRADQSLAPGQNHFAEDVAALALEQQWLCAYHGRPHVGQYFGFYGKSQRMCKCVSASMTQVLTYVIRPRKHAQKLAVLARFTSAAGGTLRIHVVETATTLDLAIPTGLGVYVMGETATLDRGDQVTTIQVSLSSAGDSVSMHGIYLCDADLTLAELP